MSITLHLTDQDLEALAFPTQAAAASMAIEGEAFGKIAAILEPLPPLSRGMVMNLVNHHVHSNAALVGPRVHQIAGVLSKIAAAYTSRAVELEQEATQKRVSMTELAATLEASAPSSSAPSDVAPVRRGPGRPRTVGVLS